LAKLIILIFHFIIFELGVITGTLSALTSTAEKYSVIGAKTYKDTDNFFCHGRLTGKPLT
jgi:hypothetical protein